MGEKEMFVELHIIQNFAPSCLNRDDTNAPKECEFGGYRRARISSQCLKRAIRLKFKDDHLLSENELGMRSKLLIEEVAKTLVAKGKNHEQSVAAVKATLAAVKISADEKNVTQYLLFLGKDEMNQLAELVLKHWDELVKISASAAPEEPKSEEGVQSEKIAEKGKTSGKDKKKAAKNALPADVVKGVKELLHKGKSVDVGLFGRMLADSPDFNIDGACQVAHAISTHKVSMEMDFYTAVDDLQKEEDSGAGMMGTVEFNSACFYRYSLIDTKQLEKNLQNSKDLVKKAISAYVRGSVEAIPTGKQNSMAAHNPPSFVLVIVREKNQPISLANAFAKPVSVFGSSEKDMVQKSIEQLSDYLGTVTTMYGKEGIKLATYAMLGKAETKEITEIGGKKAGSIDDMIKALEGVMGP